MNISLHSQSLLKQLNPSQIYLVISLDSARISSTASVVQRVSCPDIFKSYFPVLSHPTLAVLQSVLHPMARGTLSKPNLIMSPSYLNCSGIFHCCWTLARLCSPCGLGRRVSLGPDAAVTSPRIRCCRHHRTWEVCLKPSRGLDSMKQHRV